MLWWLLDTPRAAGGEDAHGVAAGFDDVSRPPLADPDHLRPAMRRAERPRHARAPPASPRSVTARANPRPLALHSVAARPQKYTCAGHSPGIRHRRKRLPGRRCPA